MTDYIARDKDRVFVFGATSMFEYRIEVDDDDNELLDLYKIWQAGYLSEKNKDDIRASLKASAGKASKGSSDGSDYIIRRGDRVFVVGDIGMFEYRWNVIISPLMLAWVVNTSLYFAISFVTCGFIVA